MIWVVTSPEQIHGEAAYLNALADAGPVTLLLRKPHWDLHAYTSLLEQLHDHSKVMITAYPELLLRYPVKGLHVSEGMRGAVMGIFRREQMLKSARQFPTELHESERVRKSMTEFLIKEEMRKTAQPSAMGLPDSEEARELMMRFLIREEMQKTGQQSATELPNGEGTRGAEGASAVEPPSHPGRTPELQSAPHQKHILSTSIHTPHSPGEQWQYHLLGPVFDSISKTGYSGKGHLFQTVPPNSIAIGGVQASNIAKVKAMGFCGAALLGAIWQNPAEAVKNYQIIQQLWQHS